MEGMLVLERNTSGPGLVNLGRRRRYENMKSFFSVCFPAHDFKVLEATYFVALRILLDRFAW